MSTRTTNAGECPRAVGCHRAWGRRCYSSSVRPECKERECNERRARRIESSRVPRDLLAHDWRLEELLHRVEAVELRRQPAHEQLVTCHMCAHVVRRGTCYGEKGVGRGRAHARARLKRAVKRRALRVWWRLLTSGGAVGSACAIHPFHLLERLPRRHGHVFKYHADLCACDLLPLHLYARTPMKHTPRSTTLRRECNEAVDSSGACGEEGGRAAGIKSGSSRSNCRRHLPQCRLEDG